MTGSRCTPESLRGHLDRLYAISCRAGGLDSGVRLNPAGREVAEYLRRGLEDAGLESVQAPAFPLGRWWPTSSFLAAREGDVERPIVHFPLWYSSPVPRVERELVDAGYGTPGELRGVRVRGRVVLLSMRRIFHFIPTFERTGALARLARAGAAGVIVVNELHDAPSGMLALTHKQVMAYGEGDVTPYPLPALCIGGGDGRRLRDALRRGVVRVTVGLEVASSRTEAVNVVGELPGSGASDEIVLVGGHYDTWFGGALDNLASMAGMLELARHFASVPRGERPRTIVFAAIFGHEIGNQGHRALARALEPRKHRICCFLDLDGSGSTGWEVDHEGRIVETGRSDVCGIVASSNALAGLAMKALYDHDVFAIRFFDNAHMADLDGPLSELGIPTLLVISKHLYYHTPLDTPDRIPPELVHRRMEVNRQVIEGLLASPPGHFIATNTNPFRDAGPGTPREPDLDAAALPVNPRPWVDGPPRDLLFEVVPPEPRVFSPVIVWRGHFVSEGIATIRDIRWSFGSLVEKLKPATRVGPASGTVYLTPGTRTIRMTVTDRHGRASSVERKVRVRW